MDKRSRFMDEDRIIAVGLLTASDVERLGTSFQRIWPVEETGCFSGLLQAIDEADREIRKQSGPMPVTGGGRY